MDTLSSPRSQLRARYDAVVVGSGYGGGVLACRLARAGLSVAVLERGKERHPGDFPADLWNAAKELQIHTATRDVGSRSALFDFRFSRDVGILVGCGLGGTSLINANVALKADDRVFDDERWPRALRGGCAELYDGFDRAQRMLGVSLPPARQAPDGTVIGPFADLRKHQALRASAEQLGADFAGTSVYVSFTAGRNQAGVEQAACTMCGDCVVGCNVGAKNTVLMNYLPDAVAHGAEVFTEVSVLRVDRVDGTGDHPTWDVVHHGTGRGPTGPPRRVRADLVVLAAGTLGSTEILLRSRAAGLAVSARVGQHLSGNGDFLAFAYDTDREIDGMGQGARIQPDALVGPCITGVIDRRPGAPVDQGLIIQEGSIPSPLVPLMPAGLFLASLRGRPGLGWPTRLRGIAKVVWGLVRGGPSRAVARTQTFLAMGSDDDRGRIELDRDRVVIDWHGAAEQRALLDDDRTLAGVAEDMGGTYLRSPVWRSPLGNKYVTVHPLGGCDMADDASTGVVDDRGRVFDGQAGATVHHGLYVADGAIVPTPLGANPSLTITALAERIAALALAERGLAVPTDPRDEPFSHPTASAVPTMSFRERLAGKISDASGGHAGRIELLLEMETDEVDALIADLASPMQIHGLVVAPGLWSRPRPVTGTLQVLVKDGDSVDLSHMRYHLHVDGGDGRCHTLVAVKDVRDDPGWDVWRDSTTAHLTITGDRDGALVASGTVRISLPGFLRLLTSLRIDHLEAPVAIRRLLRFGTRFAGALLRTYGGVLVQRSDYRSSVVPPPQTRELRVATAERRWCDADGRWSGTEPAHAIGRLTRFRGGTKGPVLIAPGFAMATSQFLLTTTPTNLTEFLCEEGYDVWLFDYRASIDLPSSRDVFTLDDIASQDWPRAIDEVRRRTGAPDVQIVAHCVGSMTALMSVLAGAEGVRSIVSSQVTLHPVMHWFSRLKARIHLPERLEGFGLRTVEFNKVPRRADRLLDNVLRLNPLVRGERCHNPACRWVAGFFGPTHHHRQLNADTHQAITGLFGVADIRALGQVGAIVRAGHAVDHLGRDTYRPHVERLAIPVTFLAGDRNRIFYPATSERTMQWLQQHNDPALYDRVVFDGYAHLDTLIGKRAHEDIFPTIAAALDRHQPAPIARVAPAERA